MDRMDSKTVSRIWWSLTLRGILAIFFGVVAFFFTGQTLLAMVLVFGVFAVLSGVTAIIIAVRAGEAHQRWGWLAVSGAISIVAGVISIVWPGLTALTVVYLVAIWAILSGVAEIAFAFQWPDTLAHAWLIGISGAVSVVFGVLLAIWPRVGALTLTWLVGVYAIIYGGLLLYYAYRLRVLRHTTQAPTAIEQRWTAQRAQK